MQIEHNNLIQIFSRTDGHCHLCGKKLDFNHYASYGLRGAWEIDHSKPKAKGGTDAMFNLFPACITCNREKGVSSSSSIRRKKGLIGIPKSKDQKQQEQNENAVIGAGLGVLLGNALRGKSGAILGGLVGIFWGYNYE